MINLSEPALRRYRQEVCDIYAQLIQHPGEHIKGFEAKLRRISILNRKILGITQTVKNSLLQKE